MSHHWQHAGNALLSKFFGERSARERKAILWMLGIVGGALIFQLLWTAHQERHRLQSTLPTLQRELATMHTQAQVWQDLGQKAVPQNLSGAALDAMLRASIESLNAKGNTLTLRLNGARQATLQGQVAFDHWLEWVAQMHTSQRLIITRAEILRRTTPSGWIQVDAELSGAE
jgi:general secretion pathway protein M